jgi:hypothetical protein
MKINWSFIEPVRDQATRLRGDYPAQSAIVKLAEQQAEIECLRECIRFFASVIKSGEAWSETCQQKYAAAILEGKKDV